MGRRAKTGLDYFPKDVNFYDDFKIMELLGEYGPNGIVVYDATLCIIYGNSYYIECPDMDQLAARIIRMIGNRWIRKKDFVLQVVRFCADIGLFDKTLLDQNVITSVGIQRRYSEVTVRNKVNKEKYWLLKGSGQPLLSVPQKLISVTEKVVSVTEKQINDVEMQQIKEKESKEKNIEPAAPHFDEEDDDEGMDPMEAMRIWNEQQKLKR